MSIIQKYKDLDKWLIEKLKPLDVKRKFPNYICVPVFRTMLFALVLLVIADFTFSGFSFTSPFVECHSTTGYCANPFYLCTDEEQAFYNARIDIQTINTNSIVANVQCNSFPLEFCKTMPCNHAMLRDGEHYGRRDFISQYGSYIILLLIILAFVVNHLIYFFRTGNVWYRRVE